MAPARHLRARSSLAPRALLVAALLMIVSSVPVSAVEFGPVEVLRTAPHGTRLRVGDISSASSLAVVWQERGGAGPRSYVRWSRNDGETFLTPRALHGGAAAGRPRVATCGAYVWATSEWPAGDGPPEVGLDFWDVPPSATPFEHVSYPVGVGRGADVTCSDPWVAVAWFDTSTSPARVKLRLALLSKFCDPPCVGLHELDLGPSRPGRALSVAAARRPNGSDDVHVGWVDGDELRYKRVTVIGSGVVIRPTQTIAASPSLRFPLLAADETGRVVVAYDSAGETRLRISDDRGATFGSRLDVWPAPCVDCEAGSFPTSVDIWDGRILVEAFGGDPGGQHAAAFLSTDDGLTWPQISTHATGIAVGALVRLPDLVVGVAEAWDTSRRVPEPHRHRLEFHTGPS